MKLPQKQGLAAIVLASGYSRRMGQNKLLLPLGEGGETVISRVLGQIAPIGYSAVIVVSQYPEILRLALERGFFAVENPLAQEGKSASIRLGLRELARLEREKQIAPAAGAVFFTGDQIFLSRSLLWRLREAFLARPQELLFPSFDGQIGSPGTFPRDCFADLAELRGEAGGMSLVQSRRGRLRLLPAESALEGFDFDTPEQWQQALVLWQQSKN